MSNEMVNVLNLETGRRGRIRRRLFDNPVFNNGILVEVDEDKKSYVPELYKSKVETEHDADAEDSPEAIEEEED